MEININYVLKITYTLGFYDMPITEAMKRSSVESVLCGFGFGCWHVEE
jgi:hypothetical protein